MSESIILLKKKEEREREIKNSKIRNFGSFLCVFISNDGCDE